jgi:hypothetical protein
VVEDQLITEVALDLHTLVVAVVELEALPVDLVVQMELITLAVVVVEAMNLDQTLNKKVVMVVQELLLLDTNINS